MPEPDKRWTIGIDYTTADSFNPPSGSYSEIGISWANYDKAIEALARIKDRYLRMDYDRHSYLWEMLHKGKSPPPPLAEQSSYDPKHGDCCSMFLQLDDGTEHPVHTFWEGYFERLVEAKVILATPDLEDDASRFRP